MFSGNSETKLEGGHLRSGKIFRLGKRRRDSRRRGIFSVTEIGDFELAPHRNKESCDKEE